MAHKTDFKDALYEQKKYRMIPNADGTVTPTDETEYTQVGDRIGALYLKEVGMALNELEEPTFNQATKRENLKSKEKIQISFGKIMKFFADLKAVAFSGSYNDLTNKPSIPSGAAASLGVANNCTTTAAGSVLDARQGKTLMDKITQQSSDISKAIGYIDYTSATDLSNIGTGATISEDGVVRLIASRYVTGNFEPRLYINDALVWTENMAPYGSCGIQSQYFPVKKSDTVRATFSGCDTGRVEFCIFR